MTKNCQLELVFEEHKQYKLTQIFKSTSSLIGKGGMSWLTDEMNYYEIDKTISGELAGTYSIYSKKENKYIIEGLQKYQAEFVMEILTIRDGKTHI